MHVLRPFVVSFLLLLPLVTSRQSLAQTEVVRVVLFFSPTCPHCHDVIQDQLPIFFNIYGGEPRVWMDRSVADVERSLYLMYNQQLEILLVDVTRPLGGRLFIADLESHGIPPEQGSVPRMVFGNNVLIGGLEIPSRFHPLMRRALAAGGLDWPAIPGLVELTTAFPTAPVAAADSQLVAPLVAADSAAARAQPTDTADVTAPGATAAPQTPPADAAATSATHTAPQAPPVADRAAARESATEASLDTSVDSATDSADAVAWVSDRSADPFEVVPARRPTMVENLRRDPLGNGLSVVALLGMVVSVVVVAATKRYQKSWTRPPAAILVVAFLGIVFAGYLSYVETSGVTAVCGPVGDCNTVQQSEHAVLFGVVPVGTLGLLAYIAIVAMWFMARLGSQPTADYAGLLLLVTAFVGTVFSIYLTFLEPFVIGATCAWCLASSVAITILLWLSAGSGKAAWARIRS